MRSVYQEEKHSDILECMLENTEVCEVFVGLRV